MASTFSATFATELLGARWRAAIGQSASPGLTVYVFDAGGLGATRGCTTMAWERATARRAPPGERAGRAGGP